MDALLASSAGTVTAPLDLLYSAVVKLWRVGPWKIWNLYCNQWPRQAKKPSAQWAMILRLLSLQIGIGACIILPAELLTSHKPANWSLRERHVMTLRTRLGNLGNILDEDQNNVNILSQFTRPDCTGVGCTKPLPG